MSAGADDWLHAVEEVGVGHGRDLDRGRVNECSPAEQDSHGTDPEDVNVLHHDGDHVGGSDGKDGGVRLERRRHKHVVAPQEVFVRDRGYRIVYWHPRGDHSCLEAGRNTAGVRDERHEGGGFSIFHFEFDANI